MKKNFLKVSVLCALAVSGSTTFVGCADYDDDIKNLQEQITTNATDLNELVTEKVNNLTQEINSLKAQDATLQEALDAAKAELAATIEEAAQGAKDYADVQAEAAKVAAIEAAKASIEEARVALQAGLDEANEAINKLNSQVATQEETISTLLEADKTLQEAINVANGEIVVAKDMATKAQEAAEAAQATADDNAESLKQLAAQLEAVSTQLGTVNEDLSNQISLLGEEVDEVVATVAQNKADVDAQLVIVNQNIQANADAIKTLQEKDAALDLKDQELLEKITKNSEELVEMAEDLTAMKAMCEANLVAAKEYANSLVSALEAEMTGEFEAVRGELAQSVANLQGTDELLQSLIDTNKKDIEDLAALVKENYEDVLTQIGTINSRLDVLDVQVGQNATDIETLKGKADQLTTDLETVKATAEETKESLGQLWADYNQYVEKNDQALVDMKTELEQQIATSVNNLNTSLTQLINTKVSDLDVKIQGQINGLQGQLDSLLDPETGIIKVVNDAIAANKTAIENLQTKLYGTDGLGGDIKNLTDKIQANTDKITNEVNTLNAKLTNLLGLLSAQLKSLVFAPTSFVDGIECIQFSTLKYQDWGNSASNWERDAAIGNNPYYAIDDAEQEAEYFANPKNVKKEDIAKLEFVSNNASNTRAVNPQAPIAVADWSLGNNENGAFMMNLKLKKTTTNSFGTDRDNFTIVSLKATLADKFLTEEQKENGEEVVVYSDWARLYETSVTPKIHNTLASSERDAAAHFWNYSTVYNNSGKNTELPANFNDAHVAKQVYYEDEIDLLSLVEVCDNNGNTYDEEKYGLEYEFHIMDYKLKNQSNLDATNQKYFAKKLEDGHTLVSTARNGEEKNRDAIGRQPMIQVVLKDVRDPQNVRVVDVRYFKIKWIDKQVIENYGPITDPFTGVYNCTSSYQLRINEEKVNAIYTKYNMSRDEFHNNYNLYTGLFLSKADAENGSTTPNANLGTINDLADWADPGQTHNLEWSLSAVNNQATQAEYENGKKTIVAYGYFQSKINVNNRIVFSVQLDLTIPQMAYASGVNKDQTMWKDGARNVNPQLESDATYGNSNYATTMILGSLLQGYINNGQTPATVEDLVNFYDNVGIVFDASGLNALAEATNTSVTSWTIANSGKTLNYNGISAATIDPLSDKVQLTESANGTAASVPTEGAKLLVGKYVPVKLEDTWCSLYDVIDSYKVNFLTPLAFTANYSNIELSDITPGGSKSSSLAGTIEIKELFTTSKRVVYDNKANNSQTNATLVDWYAVKTPVYNTTQAKTNIQPNGSIGANCTTLLSSLTNADGTQKYTVDVTGNTVTFHNKSGNAIGQEFKIEIPVSVETKWQSMSAKLIITIKPSI